MSSITKNAISLYLDTLKKASSRDNTKLFIFAVYNYLGASSGNIRDATMAVMTSRLPSNNNASREGLTTFLDQVIELASTDGNEFPLDFWLDVNPANPPIVKATIPAAPPEGVTWSASALTDESSEGRHGNNQGNAPDLMTGQAPSIGSGTVGSFTVGSSFTGNFIGGTEYMNLFEADGGGMLQAEMGGKAVHPSDDGEGHWLAAATNARVYPNVANRDIADDGAAQQHPAALLADRVGESEDVPADDISSETVHDGGPSDAKRLRRESPPPPPQA
ncbi:hypothetical protein MPSEU_000459300 [Mayamaea pseudoterrestris]|nr:hypothetical protein MPSEU_000459300 [Mayamaea pseudoterrestris]